jgi:hypothetical protein
MTWGYVFYVFVLLPLVAVAYLLLAGYLIYRAVKHGKKQAWRISAAILLPVIFAGALFGDALVGRLRFFHLCDAEASTNIHRVVTLDKKYFRADGFPMRELLPARDGFRIASHYTMRFSEEQVFAWPKIIKTRVQIKDEANGDVLGEAVNFRYWGGWLVEWLPGHRQADACPRPPGERVSLEKLVFKS